MRGAFLALVLACLCGCSTIKVAYNQADVIAYWMADDAFELTGEQRDAFRERFQRIHAWHRSTQLPEYAALLVAAKQRLGDGVQEADFAWAVETVKAQYGTLVARGHADAASVLASLSDRQLEAAGRDFEKRNRKFTRANGVGAGADEQRRLRAKRHLERIEHWTGALSAAQQARITALSRELPLTTELRHRDRIRRQREFLALLEGRRDTAFAARLRDWLLDWERRRSPEYEAAHARFIAASARMYAAIFAMLTAEQRAHVEERLQRYIDALRELAREAPRTAMQSRTAGDRDGPMLSR